MGLWGGGGDLPVTSWGWVVLPFPQVQYVAGLKGLVEFTGMKHQGSAKLHEENTNARLALECCKRLLWRQSTVCLRLSHFCWPRPAPTSSGFAKWLQDVGDLGPVVQRPDNFIWWIRHHSRSKICFMLWTFSTVVRVSIFAVTRGNIEIFVQIETVRWWLIYGIKLSGLWITGPWLSAGVGYTFKWFPDVGELTETLPIWM